MKNLTKFSVVALLMLLTASAFAQSEKGLFLVGKVGSTNVSRDQRMLITLSPEVGYMGGVFGVAAVYNNTVNLYKGSKVSFHNPKGQASSYGVKVYGKVLKVDALSFLVNMEADRYIQRIDKNVKGDYELRPGATVALTVYKKFTAQAAYQMYLYQQGKTEATWRKKHGGSIGLGYTF